MVPYVVDAVVAVTVMHVLLFLLHVCMLLGGEGDSNAVRGVGGVCDMCMARGGEGRVGGEWVTGLGMGFTNSGGTWGKCDMCLFWLR